MTEYKIETIGASFTKKDLNNLTDQFNAESKRGWEFYDAYSIENQGCLGMGNTVTYIAVYKKETSD